MMATGLIAAIVQFSIKNWSTVASQKPAPSRDMTVKAALARFHDVRSGCRNMAAGLIAAIVQFSIKNWLTSPAGSMRQAAT